MTGVGPERDLLRPHCYCHDPLQHKHIQRASSHHFWCENGVSAVAVSYLEEGSPISWGGGAVVREAEITSCSSQHLFPLCFESAPWCCDIERTFHGLLFWGPNCFEVQVLSVTSSPTMDPGPWKSRVCQFQWLPGVKLSSAQRTAWG